MFCVSTNFHIWSGSKFNFRKLNHYWKCRERKKIFQLTLVIMFWNFTMSWYRSELTQVKRNLISSIINFPCELPFVLPSSGRPRILGNQEILEQITNLGGDIAQHPVSLPQIKLWQQQSKYREKCISNFSCPVQFYQTFYFVQIFYPGLQIFFSSKQLSKTSILEISRRFAA